MGGSPPPSTIVSDLNFSLESVLIPNPPDSAHTLWSLPPFLLFPLLPHRLPPPPPPQPSPRYHVRSYGVITPLFNSMCRTGEALSKWTACSAEKALFLGSLTSSH